MRLIDADALFTEIKERHDMYADCEYIGDKARRDELSSFMADIVNAPTIGGWISVKDRLPEESGYVLTYNGNCDVLSFSKRWQKFNAYDALNNADNAIDVTHWQRLPEPPKEES